MNDNGHSQGPKVGGRYEHKPSIKTHIKNSKEKKKEETKWLAKKAISDNGRSAQKSA